MICRPETRFFFLPTKTQLIYLKFVGYSSGVYKNILINEPMEANLPKMEKNVDKGGSHGYIPKRINRLTYKNLIIV